MIISKVQHTIDALEQALPKSFIFVLDTTDRSFLYRSRNRQDCTDKIIALDQKHSIDKLTNNSVYYTCEEDDNTLILRKMSAHSFLGVCLFHREHDLKVIDLAKRILMN